MTVVWILLPLAVTTSIGLTGLLRGYAVKHQLLDVPNARSSHTIATPSGGGMAIAGTFLVCLILLLSLGLMSGADVLAIGVAGGAVSIIGFLDDRRGIQIAVRILVHFVAAAWALYWLDGMPTVSLLGFDLPSGTILNILAVGLIVWMLNLYNFMDGIDGIAGIEAITVCASAATIHWLFVPDSSYWLLPGLLGASAAGFLFWNYPTARIFMGDSGSGFVGFSLGVLAIQAAWEQSQLFWCWLILLGVFVVDASATLLRRLLSGEKIYTAHRSHAYQRAARLFGSHRTVTNAVAAINLVWLFPWALATASGKIDGSIGLLFAYAPLLWLAIHFRAGVRGD